MVRVTRRPRERSTHPVEFDFLARVQPPTSSFPFVEFFSKPGEVTLAGDGSLTISEIAALVNCG